MEKNEEEILTKILFGNDLDERYSLLLNISVETIAYDEKFYLVLQRLIRDKKTPDLLLETAHDILDMWEGELIYLDS